MANRLRWVKGLIFFFFFSFTFLFLYNIIRSTSSPIFFFFIYLLFFFGRKAFAGFLLFFSPLKNRFPPSLSLPNENELFSFPRWVYVQFYVQSKFSPSLKKKKLDPDQDSFSNSCPVFFLSPLSFIEGYTLATHIHWTLHQVFWMDMFFNRQQDEEMKKNYIYTEFRAVESLSFSQWFHLFFFSSSYSVFYWFFFLLSFRDDVRYIQPRPVKGEQLRLCISAAISPPSEPLSIFKIEQTRNRQRLTQLNIDERINV